MGYYDPKPVENDQIIEYMKRKNIDFGSRFKIGKIFGRGFKEQFYFENGDRIRLFCNDGKNDSSKIIKELISMNLFPYNVLDDGECLANVDKEDMIKVLKCVSRNQQAVRINTFIIKEIIKELS